MILAAAAVSRPSQRRAASQFSQSSLPGSVPLRPFGGSLPRSAATIHPIPSTGSSSRQCSDVAAVKAEGHLGGGGQALNRMIENRLRSGAYTVAWMRVDRKSAGRRQGPRQDVRPERQRRAAAGYAREAAADPKGKSLTNAALRELGSWLRRPSKSCGRSRKWQQRVRHKGCPRNGTCLGAAGCRGAVRTPAAFRPGHVRLDPKLVAGVGLFRPNDPRSVVTTTRLAKRSQAVT